MDDDDSDGQQQQEQVVGETRRVARQLGDPRSKQSTVRGVCVCVCLGCRQRKLLVVYVWMDGF